MLHRLPTPVRGATHVQIEEAEINVARGYCVLRRTLGSAASGADAFDPQLPQWERVATLIGGVDQQAPWGG